MFIPILEILRIFFFHRMQIRMTSHILLTALQNTYTNIGTMIRDPLQARCHIRQHKSHLNGAFSLFQTDNMTSFQSIAQVINNPLQRLDLFGQFLIVITQCLNGQIYQICYRSAQIHDLGTSLKGHFQTFLLHLLRAFL
mgnify:CR=1 FL=1